MLALSQYPTSQSNEEILTRISNLENLIQQHVRSTSTSTSRDQVHYPSPSSNATDVTNWRTDISRSPIQKGLLLDDGKGYTRYVVYYSMSQADEIDTSELRGDSEVFQGQNMCFPFAADTTTSRQSLLDRLPATSQILYLKKTYFSVFSPLFHVLHDPSFDLDFSRFLQNPESVHLSFLALIFVVLALAITALEDEDTILSDLGRGSQPGKNAQLIAQRYRTEAMRTLAADQFMWQHNLHTVQALVLLTYAMSHANCPSWSLLGTTLNIAIAIGCHVDPDHLRVNTIVAEERRRSWAALMMLHTIQSTCLGIVSPISIMKSVTLPRDVNDEDLGLVGVDQNAHIEVLPAGPTKMTYLLRKFKLYQLASDICQAPTPNHFDSEQRTIELDEKIRLEELKQLGRYTDISQLPIYHQAHHYILSSFTNHLYVILHKTIVKNATAQKASMGRLTHYQMRSLTRCVSSVFTILSNYDILQSDARYSPYKWYTNGLGSFHAFFAAAMLAFLMSRGGRESYIDVDHGLTTLQRTAAWFNKYAHRSDICAKATSILARTLKAIQYTRAVNAACESPTSGAGTEPEDHIRSQRKGQPLRNPSSLNGLDENDQPNVHVNDHVSHSLTAADSFAHSVLSTTANVDTDAWNGDPELEALLTDLSARQWMAPTAFPWSTP